MLGVLRWQRAMAILKPGVAGLDPDARLGGHSLAAFVQLLRSPYLALIALFVFLLTWISTFLYLEQQALVAQVFTRSRRADGVLQPNRFLGAGGHRY